MFPGKFRVAATYLRPRGKRNAHDDLVKIAEERQDAERSDELRKISGDSKQGGALIAGIGMFPFQLLISVFCPALLASNPHREPVVSRDFVLNKVRLTSAPHNTDGMGTCKGTTFASWLCTYVLRGKYCSCVLEFQRLFRFRPV